MHVRARCYDWSKDEMIAYAGFAGRCAAHGLSATWRWDEWSCAHYIGWKDKQGAVTEFLGLSFYDALKQAGKAIDGLLKRPVAPAHEPAAAVAAAVQAEAEAE